MAAPRIFVSSTCYDLENVRHALREFITGFGFEPVMSEFGDIFYAYDTHVQDACIDAIEKCNLFLMIIGNHYGSVYHLESETRDVPSSVTLKEFGKALATDIPKHIFVNRFVNHDYRNFRRYLEQQLKEHFDGHDVTDEETPNAKQKVRATVDQTYPFPQASYRYIFHFLDKVNDLKVNNAILPFEVFSDITDQLRQQWAGFMLESLTSSRMVSVRVVEDVTSRLDSFEKILRQLITSKKEEPSGNISLNIEAISQSLAPAELKQAQDMLEEATNAIIYHDNLERGYISSELSYKNVSTWLNALGTLLKNYKWSNTVLFEQVMEGIGGNLKIYTKRNRDVPMEQLMKLYGLYRNIPEAEREPFARSVLLKLKPIIRPEKVEPKPDEDSLPF